ncbi:O-methyltransferase [Candidatus Finniella inopinata]|uniref:Class I SAM-dependent methyltransferase n=1 Tax=Candidatus Finniella inopinata TaxID=1696036 RepID=A0A4Q7DF46_9PROT|nr:class I SAM-dependent methyltransferase [Candidatus Finniella inopinata]RZI45313.1 class I SAM-dependent methyltransferase [Candidatus Finniella inopinata]
MFKNFLEFTRKSYENFSFRDQKWSLISGGIIVALCVSVMVLLETLNRYKQSFRQENLWSSWVIKKVNIDEFDDCFKPEHNGPSKNTEISFIGSFGTRGSTSDFETWILCTIAKSAQNIFEFGTFTGKTTYLLAKNSPNTAKIVTLTLSPDEITTYTKSNDDHQKDTKAALEESIFKKFYYSNTPLEHKVEQRFIDSKKFDERPYLKKFDLIFIDGSHAESYVENDSKKALQMVKPGGVILWHDYRGPDRAPGVYNTLNKLSKTMNLVHIAGTSLVAYRAPK